MTVNVNGGSGAKDGRDSACTPLWLAKLIGRVEVDVASNERSNIDALWALWKELGDDGLHGSAGEAYMHAGWSHPSQQVFLVPETWTVFCNPPYARGQVIRWVRHWNLSRFIFLLRWDPSTRWFAELIQRTDYVWFPSGRRIEFEPPPGVTFSKNPFPHALYLRDPSPDLLTRLRGAGYLLDAREVRRQIAEDGHRQDSGAGEQGEAVAAGAGNGRAGDGPADSGTSQAERGIAAWIPASCPKCGLFEGHCSCDPAGGEVPSDPPRRQRIRGNRERRATSFQIRREVGAEEDAGGGDRDV